MAMAALGTMGCSARARLHQPAGAPEAWVQQRGGLTGGTVQRRAARARARLLPSPAGREVTVHVLESGAIGAYAWPSGDVFVTRGLIVALDDQELAAAIAHEMGHLAAGGHLPVVSALEGSLGPMSLEARADRLGCRLLEARGIPAEAMARMLGKVRALFGANATAAAAIGRRIDLLPSPSSPGARGSY